MKKRTLIILGVILFVIIGAVVGISIAIRSISEELNSIVVNDVDLSQVEDGIYEGSYHTLPVSADVKVTVSNHKITKIEIIRHDNGQGKAAETIVDHVIEEQKLTVDVISGATHSSKVILKAIEDALSN